MPRQPALAGRGATGLSAGVRRGASGARVSNSWRVLVAESDDEAAATLVCDLRRHGHKVERVDTGVAALRAYDCADLMLLDLELPDLDGLEVCRRVRSAGTTALIAVTARGAELDCVLGLQAGADDYVVKPYGFRELLARMEAVMRRIQAHWPESRVLTHGDLQLDLEARSVTLRGRRIDVTSREFDLLYVLAVQPDTVVPRELIMREVWGDGWSRRTIDTHIGNLRSKLGDCDWILTVPGVGLQLGGC